MFDPLRHDPEIKLAMYEYLRDKRRAGSSFDKKQEPKPIGENQTSDLKRIIENTDNNSPGFYLIVFLILVFFLVVLLLF